MIAVLTPDQANQLEAINKLAKVSVNTRDTLEQVKIQFNPIDKVVMAHATDSFRIAQWEFNVDTENDEIPTEITVKASALTAALKAARDLKAHHIDLAFMREHTYSTTTELTVSAMSALDNELHSAVIPASTLTMPDIMSDRVFAGPKVPSGRISPNEGGVETDELSEWEALKIPLGAGGEDLEFILPMFNPQYMADMYALLGTTAKVRGRIPFMQMTHTYAQVGGLMQLKPWAWVGHTKNEDAWFQYVLMPIRKRWR